MEYFGLIELILVFGGTMGWSWYEYRKSDREAKRMRREQEALRNDKAKDQLNNTDEDRNVT